MEYTPENIEKVTEQMVDSFDLKDLYRYVYDDLHAIMVKDEEMFHINVESFNLELAETN